MKRRILRDPNSGEIVGATRVPFLKAKLEAEFNDQSKGSNSVDGIKEELANETLEESQKAGYKARIFIWSTFLLIVSLGVSFFID